MESVNATHCNAYREKQSTPCVHSHPVAREDPNETLQLVVEYVSHLEERIRLLSQPKMTSASIEIASPIPQTATSTGNMGTNVVRLKRPRPGSVSPIRIQIETGDENLVAFRDLSIHDTVYIGDITVFVRRDRPDLSLSISAPSGKYRLFLDDNDRGIELDPCQYNLYLPAGTQLSRVQHDIIIDRVLTFYAPWCLRLHPYFLLRDMYAALHLQRGGNALVTTHYSAMLHNAILALGLAFADDPKLRRHEFRAIFAQEAKKYVEIDGIRPTLATVQAFAILANFHSGLGQQGLGFMYMGHSIRMTQTLGLNIDHSTWIGSGEATTDQVIQRTFVYWSCYAQDKCWAMYVGREGSVALPKIPLPEIDPDLDNLECNWPPSKLGPQQCLFSTAFVESCKLLSILGTRIFEALYNNQKDFKKELVRVIMEIHVSLKQWYQDLPNKLILHRGSPPGVLLLHMAYWWMTIIIYRPLFRETSKIPPHSTEVAPSATDACKLATQSIITLLRRWKECYGLRFSPVTIVQIAFNAGVTGLLLASEAESSTQNNGFNDALECVNFLKEIGISWASANYNAEVLERLIEKRKKDMVSPFPCSDANPVVAERKSDVGEPVNSTVCPDFPPSIDGANPRINPGATPTPNPYKQRLSREQVLFALAPSPSPSVAASRKGRKPNFAVPENNVSSVEDRFRQASSATEQSPGVTVPTSNANYPCLQPPVPQFQSQTAGPPGSETYFTTHQYPIHFDVFNSGVNPPAMQNVDCASQPSNAGLWGADDPLNPFDQSMLAPAIGMQTEDYFPVYAFTGDFLMFRGTNMS